MTASIPLCLVAFGLLAWPPGSGRARLGLDGRAPRFLPRAPRFLPRAPRFSRWLVLGAAGAGGCLLANPGGAIAAMVLLGIVLRCRAQRRRSAEQLTATTDLAFGLRQFAAELRAGAHPAEAAEGAALDATPAVARLFREVAIAARLGGEVAGLLDRASVVGAIPGLGRLARAWALAERHGIALVDLVHSLVRDLDSRAAFLRDVETRLSGARASALVLAGLPVLGLALSLLGGASTWQVLVHHPVGQVLLVVGASLLAVGVWWTARVTEGAVRP